MPNVGVRELRNRLSHYLDQVKHGNKLTVTERGKVVAIISPPAGKLPDLELKLLLESGLGKWSGNKPEGAKQPVKNTGEKLSDIVINDR